MAENCSCTLCDLYQGIPKMTFAGRKMIKTEEVQRNWRQAMDLVREQSKIIHTSREIIADYQDHLSVCLTKSVDECMICREYLESLEASLLPDGIMKKVNKEEMLIQQNLCNLFGTEKLCISIFFDNPQLSKTVSAQEKMEVILETFVTKTIVKILFGRIVYSGEYDPSIVRVDPSKVRGGDVIVAEVLELVSCDLSKFPARTVDGIKELQLRGFNSPEISRVSGDITLQDIEAFFAPCTSRVDVILDPIQHDNYKFYPYYEGTRKMAPQFRSKGVGYVRLGDDMSNFGSAFLSMDHGRSFVDRGVNDRNIMKDEYEAGNNAGMLSKTTKDIPTSKPQDKRLNSLRTHTEFSRSVPLMNKSGNGKNGQVHAQPSSASSTSSSASQSNPNGNTQYPAGPAMAQTINNGHPLMIRASSAGTCDGSVTSYSTVPTSAMSISSPSASPMPSAFKKKLTESLRRMVSVNRSQSDLSLNVPDANMVDSSYVDDDDDTTAMSGLPTPKQLQPSSPSAQQLEEAIMNFETSMLQEGSTAWRVKVEIVKQLQADFELASVSIAEMVRPPNILRLLDCVREQLSKTQNPQLTIALLELIPTLASRLKVHQTSDSSVLVSWRRVVNEMIQQLRNNNRQIEMAASKFVNILSQVGPRGLSWPLLCDVLEPIVGLPLYGSLNGSGSTAMMGSNNTSTKVSKGAASSASSSSKAVGKLNKVLEFVDQWLVSDMSLIVAKATSGQSVASSTAPSMEELNRLCRIAMIGIKDRDEKTRTAGMQLLASICIAEVVFSNHGVVTSLSETLLQVSAGGPGWLQDELDRGNVQRNKLSSFFTKTLQALPNSSGAPLPSTDAANADGNHTLNASGSSGKFSGGFSASLKARKLTPSSSAVMKSNNGSNPQPPSTQSSSSSLSINVVVEKSALSPGKLPSEHGQLAPLGSKMLQLRLQEAQLLLKREPQSTAEWVGVQEVIDMADVTCNEVESICKQHQISLGALLRVLLPFTEQTSTLDQTISVVGGGDWKLQLQQDTKTQLPQLVPIQSQLVSHSQCLRKLRGLVRVKIADQSDFRQARAAVHTLKEFLQDYLSSIQGDEEESNDNNSEDSL